MEPLRDVDFETFCRRMFASSAAARLGLVNKPSTKSEMLAIAQNLGRLYDEVWRPLTTRVADITINSGFRTPAVNRALKGAASSAHLLGLAVDIESAHIGNLELARLAVDVLETFDQIILEFHTPGDASSGWVHVGLAISKPRREVLRRSYVYDEKNKRRKARYFSGLVEEV
jgi:hypothetical protein